MQGGIGRQTAILMALTAVGVLVLTACGVASPTTAAHPMYTPHPTHTPYTTYTPLIVETPSVQPTNAAEPRQTPIPLSPTPGQPSPTPTPLATKPSQVEISVYFTDSNRFNIGTPPFEVAVTRYVDPTSPLPEAVLTEFFRGPTAQERSQGLELISSGFTGFSSVTIEDGVAHVYLEGPCESGGAIYTIAQPLLANLLQVGEIRFVKIYDSQGETEEPTGASNSIPFCLEP